MRAAALLAAVALAVPARAPAAGRAFLSLAGGYLRQDGGREWLPAAAEVRLGYDADLGALRFSGDVSQQWRRRPPAAGTACRTEPERSGLLYLGGHCSANVDSRVAVDRLLLAAGRGRFDLRVGRQPVNLATGFYFSANDFFVPFREDDFFRAWRPGVDAVRLDWAAAPLSQASFIGVLSYRPADRPGGWSRSADWGGSSALVRWLGNGAGVETVLLAGALRGTGVVGASVAGEAGGWLGASAECHYGRSGDRGYVAASGAVFHRFDNSLELRLEYLYNGNWRGGEAADAPAPAAARPGRHWLALGAGGEPFPLLEVRALAAVNPDRGGRLFSLYGVLSVSDAGEIAVSLHHGGGTGYAAYGRGALTVFRFFF